MDGVLVVDNRGPDVHDVVARAAGARENTHRPHGHARIRWQPACCRCNRTATRLVGSRRLRQGYHAAIRFGMTTDSYDITGTETGRTDQVPPRAAILDGIQRLTGRICKPAGVLREEGRGAAGDRSPARTGRHPRAVLVT